LLDSDTNVSTCLTTDLSRINRPLTNYKFVHNRSILDEVSYNQIQVLELRGKLSNFIQTKDNMGLALQFACIGALLNLIPLNFKQILTEEGDLSSDKSQFGPEICQIKKWYSGLNKEQKAAFQSLLMG
jgi:hypothetical protein